LKVDGKSPTIKDRNDGLMLRVNIGLQKLIEIAAQRRRNYIIDHVNTTRESQVKRQRLFTGYHRIGVAIIPDDEELKKRIEKLEKTENISIPSQWIREAKSRFYFPQKSSSLEDVIYPELDYEEAKSLYDRARRDYEQHRSSSRYDRYDDYHSSRNNNRNRYDDRDRDHRSRDRDRYARSRSRDRDRDRRTSREDTRFSSSSHRNDNFRGGGGYSRGGGGGRYSDHRQDSRSNQRGGFHEGGGNNYRGRGGGGYHNQSNDEWRGGYQRNEFGGGRGRGGGFDNNRNQYNNRGSYHDNQRSGGFRQDSNNQQRGRQFNDYDKNPQQSGGRGFMQNNNNANNFNQQQDRQGFGSRVSYLVEKYERI
jgi:heterogeneous nuclear ribonucleoprotein U-like protein 1